MEMRVLRLAAVVSLLPVLAPAAETPAVSAVPVGVRFTEGQRLHYRLTRDTTLLRSSSPGFAAGPPAPREVTTWTFDLLPRAVATDGATADLVLRSVRSEESGPDRPSLAFDSADPSGRRPGDPLHTFSVHGLLIGVAITARFAPDGRLLEIAGAERIGDHIINALGASALLTPGDLRQTLRESFADGGDLKLALQRSLALFPGTPAGVGGEWAAVVEERHLLAGRVTIGHRFRLESIDGPLARLSVRIEAETDAAGQIPWDESEEDEDYEQALDAFSGKGAILFDLDLGHVRRYESTVRASWTNRPAQRRLYAPAEERVELRHTLELLEADGPRTPRPVVPPPGPRPSLPAFAAFKAALEKRCWVQVRGGSTPEVKGAAVQTAECLRRAFTEELDRVLRPLKDGDPRRFSALMREQARWNRAIARACPFFDEVQFLDHEIGVWSFGTAYGIAETHCKQAAAVDRTFYAATLRTGEVALLAARVREGIPAADEVREALAALRRGLAGMPAPSPDEAFRRPVTREDVRRLLDTAAAVEGRARSLAEESCANWPELTRALGGPASCAAAMESYYLQNW